MDTKVNYAVVGAFVISLVFVIIFGIIWLSSGLSVKDYSTYEVDMQEAVTGLSIDATVEYNGVSVGAVKSITLNKKDPHSVVLLLDIRDDTPITEGTVASLGTRGLTGITYIALKDKGLDLKPLKKLAGQTYPTIKTSPSLLLQLNTGLQKLTESVSQVSNTFNSLFDKENLKSIKQTLASMQAITANIAANNQKFNMILKNTSIASQRLPVVLQTFETQTLPQTNQIIANLDTITNNLAGLSHELRDNPSLLIRGKQPPTLGPGEK